MKEYYDVINVVFVHSIGLYGTVEVLGAFASKVKYEKDGVEYEEMMENDEFSILDEIVFMHIEEE